MRSELCGTITSKVFQEGLVNDICERAGWSYPHVLSVLSFDSILLPTSSHSPVPTTIPSVLFGSGNVGQEMAYGLSHYFLPTNSASG